MSAAPSGRGLMEAGALLARAETVVTTLNEGLAVQARQSFAQEEDQVVLFPDLVSSFRTMAGLDSAPLLSNRVLTLMVGEAVHSESQERGFWQESGALPGAHKAVARTLSDLRTHSDGLASWMDLAERAEGSLKEKVQFLCGVEAKVHGLAAEKGRMLPSEAIRECLSSSVPRLLGQYSHVLALMSPSDPPLAWNWLSWAAEQGVKVDAVVETRPGEEVSFAPRLPAHLGGTPFHLLPREAHWTDLIFSGRAGSASVDLKFLRAPDPLAECEWILRAIQDRLAEGLFQDDVVLVARRLEEYAPLLESAAARLGMEVSFQASFPLLANGYARALLQCLKALAQDDVRDLHRLSRSSYFPASPKEQAHLWKGLESACSQSRPWEFLAVWAGGDEFGQRWLGPLLDWRAKAMGSRLSLAAWRDRLPELAFASKALEEAVKEGPTRERDKRAMTVMQQSLADAHAAGSSGKGEKSLGQFLKAAEKLWKLETVVYPSRRSGIRVVSDPTRAGACEVLAAVGMMEGIFPRKRREDPVLHDEDRRELERLSGGRIRLPLSHDLAREERDHFVRLCAAPSKSLIFSCPQTSSEGEATATLFLEEAAAAAGKELTWIVKRVGDLTPPPEECKSGEIWLAQALQEGAAALESSPDLATEEARSHVRLKEGRTLSPSDLAAAHECLFRAQAERFLRWRGEGPTSLGSEVFHVPDEARLDVIEDEAEAEEALSRAYDRRLAERMPFLRPWQVKLLEAVKAKRIQEWLEEARRIRSHWPTRLEPMTPEREKEWLKEEVNLRGRKVKMRVRASAAGKGDGTLVVVDSSYRGSRPDTNDLRPEEGPSHISSILSWALIRRSPDALTVLESRTPSGWRVRTALIPSNDSTAITKIRASAEAGAYSLRLKAPAIEEAISAALAALGALEEGKMTPQSGSHCGTCRFGELCRRHADFGERLDLFEEGRP